MNKKIQKLNKSAVAAILATSSAVVGLPHASLAADKSFSDLTPANSHYDSILELYSRDIISGYTDGTFRPSKEVTRGQAAKMIASILNLDIYNVKNPQFKDVSSKNSYYPYIAALVERGVISGYIDNTYRPNEIITRNQMAKIIVKGFQFMETTTLNHTFNDVTNKNANRFYIQTLVNLGITQGTSAVTFSPSKSVTRGQLASFLIRAEKANVHNASVKEITKIEQRNNVTHVYVNGVKHTIHNSLKDIFSVKNTEVLKGAHIEGTIVGTEIRGLNNITFNASGAVNNVLTFDGNGATYRGAVSITGNHLKFVNWNVTGEVTIEQATAKSISALPMPLAARTIASLKLASDNIDWGTITPPSELEPDENDGLVEIPTNNKPLLPTLKTVEHNIQFVNVNIRALVITANRTKVTSNKELANVLVAGFVREFELRANVNELYIETDENVTFYGQSDIQKLYKNSYKSLNLYADSITQLIAVDNKSGWIDLGDYYYADKIIVPPNSLPHEIFNDFINDSNKIGDIEDPSGIDIDRDPVENVIVPDWEPPTLYIQNVVTQLASVKVTVNSTEDGTVHYLIKREIDGEPSIREIMQYTGKLGGNKPVAAGQDAVITVDDLADETKYMIYAVAVDEAGNVSKKVTQAFEITDATAPIISLDSVNVLNNKNNVEVNFRMNEKGATHYIIRKADEAVPTVEDVKRYGTSIVIDNPGEVYTFRKLGLEAEKDYVLYIIGEDKARNLSTSVVSRAFRTGEADLIRPFIINTNLNQDVDVQNWNGEEGATRVTLRFNEQLDPESATNLDNYQLGGTGNLTGKPYRAELSRDGKNVVLTVPSMAAFVNNDTLVITVNNVMDLSGNEVLPNSQAVLRFLVERAEPELEIINVSPRKSVEGNPNLEAKDVTFRTTAPGRYYYLILPTMDGLEPVDVEDVIFPAQYLARNSQVKYHIANSNEAGGLINAPGENIIKDIQYDRENLNFKLYKYGYDIYMVMQNRDGKYTKQVVSAKFIKDTLHPEIINKTFIESVADTSINELELQNKLNDKMGPGNLIEGNDIVTETDNPDGTKTKITYSKNASGRITKITEVITSNPDGTTTSTTSSVQLPAIVNDFRFDVDDNGEYHKEQDRYLRFAVRFSEKMERQSVETTSHYVLKGINGQNLKVAKATLLSDEQTLILDLEPISTPSNKNFEEYSLIDAEKLEIHMRNVKDKDGLSLGGNYDSNGNEILPGDETQVLDGKNDMWFTYVDNVKPVVKDIRAKFVSRNNTISANPATGADFQSTNFTYSGDIEVEVTFSENVEYVGENVNFIANGASGVTVQKVSVTGNKVKLKISTNSTTIADLQIFKFIFNHQSATTHAFIQDTSSAKNTISVLTPLNYEASYRFRAMPFNISGIQLLRPSSISDGKGGLNYYSDTFQVMANSKYFTNPLEDDIVLYYALSNSELNADQIINAHLETFAVNYGNKPLTSISGFYEFTTLGNTPFQNDQYIYFVLRDGYGNVSDVNRMQIPKPSNNTPSNP